LDIKKLNLALIFAGGVGERMGYGNLPKQFLKIGGKPIISLTIDKFQKHKDVDGILIVCVDKYINECQYEASINGFSKIIDIIPGGSTAQESILAGLRRLKEFSNENNTIMIHDGVRPVIDEELISRNIVAVAKYGSSVTIVPCNETVLFRKEGENAAFNALDREKCVIARAPQCYKIDDVLPAAEYSYKENIEFVDTYSLMENYGISASPVECDHSNIKVTTYSDFLMVKTLIEGY
jgi:2-C-methyl-D-erythritol 4-phosphate cytidylyltransferase